MDYKNLSIIELKEIIYNQQFQRFPYLKEFKKIHTLILKVDITCFVVFIWFISFLRHE